MGQLLTLVAKGLFSYLVPVDIPFARAAYPLNLFCFDKELAAPLSEQQKLNSTIGLQEETCNHGRCPRLGSVEDQRR